MNRWIKGIALTICVVALGAGAYGYIDFSNSFHFGPPDDRTAWLGQNASVNSGQHAYIQRDVDAAMDIWRTVAEDENARADDRTEALRLLSRTSWRIYQNTDDGISFALAADDVDDTKSANAVSLSAAYREAGDLDAAIVAGRNAMARAQDPLERSDAANEFARAALASTSGLRLDQYTAEQRQFLREAQQELLPFFAQPPANLETSELALEVAVRLDDGPAMLQAWGSYYHSPTGVSSTADQSGPAEALGALLPNWAGANASASTRRDVILALAHSHFYDLAVLIATDGRSAHTSDLLQSVDYREISAISMFLNDLVQHTNEYYRQIAEGNSSSTLRDALLMLTYRNGRKGLEQQLWTALSEIDDLGPYSHEAFVVDASDRFQFYLNEGSTSGVYDNHSGHRVLDTTVVADQFGRNADLRFVVVGRMVSNGYESWLWDGRQQHGGWANSEAIYQVRPAYADGPLRRWHQATNPALRADNEDEITRLSADDVTTAVNTPIGYFPGLAARLHWQGLNGILEHAQANNPPDLVRQAFILELGNTTFNSSIFAHEGRHALDKLYAEEEVQNDGTELEYRAKISEVAFSAWPRLSFGSIFNPNMGSDTSHGQANQRIAEGIAIWMGTHAREIDGLDTSIALLPQFDRLTDDQIRSAMLSLDPWAEDTANSDIAIH